MRRRHLFSLSTQALFDLAVNSYTRMKKLRYAMSYRSILWYSICLVIFIFILYYIYLYIDIFIYLYIYIYIYLIYYIIISQFQL